MIRRSLLLLLLLLPAHAWAAPPELIFRFEEQVFTLRPTDFPAWKKREHSTTYRGVPIVLPEELPPDLELPMGVQVERKVVWDPHAIAETIEEEIGHHLEREAGHVRIDRTPDGSLTFEGAGFPARRLDAALAAKLTVTALEEGITRIELPVTIEPPVVSIEDLELQALGIQELVAVGSSDFSGSPPNRRHNIHRGLSKFHGQLIPAGADFSFNAILGPVSETTGYRKELTILGERTLPDFGGGLCQVSTTLYRGIWKAGFPILERRNHSFAVRYYAPPGTDATIYPGSVDLRFQNDSGGALLLQTVIEGERAHVLFYGTKPLGRTMELIGPFTWDLRPPPEDRTEWTVEIPPGERRVVGTAVPGLKALWYRLLTSRDGTTHWESTFSQYEPRPHYEEIGVTEEELRAKERERETDRSGQER
jgi:vancomycin resistance protein YoaR